MPVPEIEALSSASSPEQVKAAVSSCIATEVRGGRPQEEATAMCSAMVEEKIRGGKPAPQGGV